MSNFAQITDTFNPKSNYAKSEWIDKDSSTFTGHISNTVSLAGIEFPEGVFLESQYHVQNCVTRFILHGKYGSSKMFLITDEITDEEFRQVVIDMLKTLPGINNYSAPFNPPAAGLDNSAYLSNKYLMKKYDSTPKTASLSSKSYGLPGITTPVDVPCKCAKSPGYQKPDLHGVIMHLNDTHKWTRERIADWIDTIPNLMQDFIPIEPDRA